MLTQACKTFIPLDTEDRLIYWAHVFIPHLLLATDFALVGLSASHLHADWLPMIGAKQSSLLSSNNEPKSCTSNRVEPCNYFTYTPALLGPAELSSCYISRMKSKHAVQPFISPMNWYCVYTSQITRRVNFTRWSDKSLLLPSFELVTFWPRSPSLYSCILRLAFDYFHYSTQFTPINPFYTEDIRQIY